MSEVKSKFSNLIWSLHNNLRFTEFSNVGDILFLGVDKSIFDWEQALYESTQLQVSEDLMDAYLE